MACRSSISRFWQLQQGSLSLAAALLAIGLCPFAAIAQEAATEEPAAEATSDDANETPAEEVDPYEVPEGTPDELFEYLQTGAERMQPQTRDDAIRMFNSLDTAAKRIFESPDATAQQRIQAAGGRMQFLSMLGRFGDEEAGGRIETFLKQAEGDANPQIQEFAKRVILQQKMANWQQLEQSARDEVVAEIRASVSGDNVTGRSVGMLLQFADAVAQSGDVDTAVELINESLPKLKEIEDPAVAERLPRLEGTVRRLQLPGNKMEVEGTLLGGDEVDWESYRGKVVLVDYWATWCGPCIAELPNVLTAYENYHEKGFDVLGISLDDDKTAVEQFIAERELPWKTLYSDNPETNGWNHPMAERYAIAGIPQAILVDQEGKVVNMNARGAVLEKALETLLGPVEKPEVGASTTTGEAASKTAQTAP